MGWIVQEYEGDAHVVPDTEAGHVLTVSCFCDPGVEIVMRSALVTHRDEMQRIVEGPLCEA